MIRSYNTRRSVGLYDHKRASLPKNILRSREKHSLKASILTGKFLPCLARGRNIILSVSMSARRCTSSFDNAPTKYMRGRCESKLVHWALLLS